jgi:catechol-2,3-dioxygenase
MKKAFLITFVLGFTVNNLIMNKPNDNSKMKRVTGIGGIFFKCKDPNKMREWYKTHLGLNTNKYGTVLSGGKLLIQLKKDIHNGVPLAIQLSILNLQQKIL